jgi:hypothetical protein
MDHAAPTAIRDDALPNRTVVVFSADDNLIVREEMWPFIECHRDLSVVRVSAERDEVSASATRTGA